MAGLGYALAGLGQGILQQASERREDALMSLKRGWDIEDRNAGYARDDTVYARGRSDDLEDYGRQRADKLDDYGRMRNDALSDEARGYARQDAKTGKAANVYASLFGTESGGNFSAKNEEGYMGRSQFGQSRLDDFTQRFGVGRITPEQFRKDPALQEKVEQWHFRDINESIDRDDLTKYEGTVINGVPVTRSGMIAAAHLGGTGGMKRYLESGGKYDPSDSNGTSLSGYMRTHGGLPTDTSGVWEVLADPDTPESVRDDLRQAAGIGGKAANEFTNQVWVRQADGSSIRMGYRKSDNAYMPVLGSDGKPLTQAAQRSASDVELSAGVDLRLKKRIDAAVTEGFVSFEESELALEAVKGEVARLMNEDGSLSEEQAEEQAWASMSRKSTTMPAVDGWFRDKPEETVTDPWDGTFARGQEVAAAAATDDQPAVDYDAEASRAAAKKAISDGKDPVAVRAALRAAGISDEGI